MKTEIVKVTPDIAAEMLSRNSTNRTLRNNRVKYYAQQMKEGKWHLTGQTITFAKDGQLLDGQHRLWAVIEADVPVEFLVVYDADKVSTYDCGLKRSTRDQLKLGGVQFSNAIMSSAGIAIAKQCMHIEQFGAVMQKGRTFAVDDIQSWIEKNYDDCEYFAELSYQQSGSSAIKGSRRASIYATLWGIYKLGGITKNEIDRVVEIIKTGLAKEEQDAPVVGFRNKLLAESRMNDLEVSHRLQYAVYHYLKETATIKNRYEAKSKYDFTKLKKEEQ